MPKYMIEVSHEGTKESCERAVETFLATGSHFMTNANWGCPDEVHKAWIIAELDNKEDALNIVPPVFRKDTKVVLLQNFSPTNIAETIEQHKD